MQTIEFTTADANSELPPPMTVDEVIRTTLAQKKMAAMIMEDTADEVEAVRARQAAESGQAANGGVEAEGDGMDVSDNEDEEAKERKRKEEEERQREIERARAIQATSMDASGPMKIRTDYVPSQGWTRPWASFVGCPVRFGCCVRAE